MLRLLLSQCPGFSDDRPISVSRVMMLHTAICVCCLVGGRFAPNKIKRSFVIHSTHCFNKETM